MARLPLLRVALCVALVCSAACQGDFVAPRSPAGGQPPPASTTVPPQPVACTVASPGHTRIRRLTTGELQHALSELLGVEGDLLAGVDADIPGASGFTNDGSTLTMGYLRVGQLLGAIEGAVGKALAAPGSTFLACPNGARDAACARTVLEQFATRAYRRPLQASEASALLEPYTENAAGGFTVALGLAMQRVLLSPSFLYLTTFSGPSSAKGVALAPNEFAARLAFFVWSSPPDERLTTLAAQGTLQQPEVLKAELSRMLQDPRAAHLVDDLFGQWLGFPKVLDGDRVLRQGLTAPLRAAYHQETRTFLQDLVSEDRSLMTLVTADHSYLDAELAARYGIAGVTGTGFQRVALAGTSRRGVLAQGAVLTVLSNPAESRPVARGHFILDQLLCAPPPPPPGNIDTSALAGPSTGTQTVRQRLEQHVKAGAACAGCHAQMDPLGLSMENFDQVGAYRTVYANGQSVDASGTVLGHDFTDFAGMNTILAGQPQLRSCLATHVLTYALGRAAGPDEACVAQQLAQVAVRDDSTFSDLLFAIASSEMFTLNSTDSHAP